VDEGEHKGRTESEQGNTKGENDKIEIVKGRLEVLEKGQRGRPERDLTGTCSPYSIHLPHRLTEVKYKFIPYFVLCDTYFNRRGIIYKLEDKSSINKISW